MSPKLTPSAVALALSASVVTIGSNKLLLSAEEVISPRGGTSRDTPRNAQSIIFVDNTYRDIDERKNLFLFQADVGILSGDNRYLIHEHSIPHQSPVNGDGTPSIKSSVVVSSRILQEGYDRTCAYPETCEPNLCACTAQGGNGYDCAAEIHAVCNKVTDANGTVWTLDGCTGDTKYYRKNFCPFAKCIVEGGTYGSCYCQFYQTVCDIYGDRPKYMNDTDTVNSCAVAACCQTKTDEDGRKSCFTSVSKSSGESLVSWNNVRATTLAVSAVAWSLLC